ncbi:hypothetical protein CcI49_29095 [Frankia sp. CcI49]|uniref:hypothetical protein n=1 Tax=Frankia sp. CcI49 TaxID=1745382 RepID=UPI00097718EB|nr:hypothetical protein [Frankia sp. CcI49]ONH55562.1 hypothetical protein CcI49_29095 [Frankia sp. CcI49]
MSTGTITLQQACSEVLGEAMAADPSVFVLGEDVADRQGGGFRYQIPRVETAIRKARRCACGSRSRCRSPRCRCGTAG